MISFSQILEGIVWALKNYRACKKLVLKTEHQNQNFPIIGPYSCYFWELNMP